MERRKSKDSKVKRSSSFSCKSRSVRRNVLAKDSDTRCRNRNIRKPATSKRSSSNPIQRGNSRQKSRRPPSSNSTRNMSRDRSRSWSRQGRNNCAKKTRGNTSGQGSRSRRSRSQPEGSRYQSDRRRVPAGSSSSSNSRSPSARVTRLPTPIKSPLDYNSYRAIRLENGLHAILIADTENGPESGSESSSDEDEDSNCVHNQVAKFNKAVIGLPKKDCCHCAPRAAHLDSGRKKKKAKKKWRLPSQELGNFCEYGSGAAAVSLSVHAGCFDEPDDIPGLAHMTEHSVFLGSKKYPNSHTIDSFLAKHGGSQNGTTEGNNTTFIFCVECGKLDEAFQMFMDNITEPLFKPANIIEERNSAVDKEFQDKRDMEELRRTELRQMMSKKGCPFTRFGWGTIETIRTRDGRDQSLADRVKAFYDEHYTVDNMSIAIMAPASLDTLEELVVKVCGHLKPSGKKRILWRDRIPKEYLNPYDTPEFRRWYNVIPAKSVATELILTWSFPRENYRKKSLTMIGQSISSEHEKGLVYYLRQRYWIKSVSAAPGITFCEYNEVFTLFSINISLTKRGTDNVESILEALFSYIKYLNEIGPQEWLCTEFKHTSALEFHFNDKLALDTYEFCKTLAKDLRAYGPDIITADALICDWDFQLIETYLAMLKPATCNYMMSNKKHKDCRRAEPYFGAKYSVKDVPQQLKDRLNSVTSKLYAFEPIEENQFISTNFCPVWIPNALNMHPNVCNEPLTKVGPHCVVDTERYELWHKLDSELASEAVYLFELISPLPLQSAQNTAMLDLWIYILDWSLKPLTQKAALAQLRFSVFKSYRGAFIEVDGLSQKLEQLLVNILEHIHNLGDKTSRESFELGKQGQLKEYLDVLLNPSKLSKTIKTALTIEKHWIENDLYDALKGITFDNFKTFCHDFIAELFIMGLAQGNVADSGVLQLRNDIRRILRFEPILKILPQMRIVELPLGETIIRIQNTDKSDNHSIIMNVYRIGDSSLQTHAMCSFLVDQMVEPAMYQLRGKDGLCYQVEVKSINNKSSVELVITVQTSSDEFRATFVNEKIDEFMLSFYKNVLYKMSQADFIDRAGLFGETDDTADNNWKEIKNGTFQFDRNSAEAIILQGLDVEYVKDFYHAFFLAHKDSQMRKLSIQIVGDGDNSFPLEFIECKRHQVLDEHSFCRTDMTTNCNDGSETGDAYDYPLVYLRPKHHVQNVITHIQTFKQNLFLYGHTLNN